MRIGIITIYDAYNYGSFLQAFAMQEFLRQMGHQPVILCYDTSLHDFVVRKLFAKSVKRTIFKLRRFLTYRKDWKKLNIENHLNVSSLDCVIVGSDEVWNIENSSFSHIPQFYGIECPSSRIIAYGPSLGYSTNGSYDGMDVLKAGLRDKFTGFMVRDLFTYDFLKEITTKQIEMVCDPTLLLATKWEEYQESFEIDKPYLLYYSYKEDSPYIDVIKKYAKEKGLMVVVAGFNYEWADKVILPTPLQFLSIVKNANCIVTSTFHGTVFSTLLHKQFVVVHPAVKVTDYLNQLGLTREVNNSSEEFFDLMSNVIDYNIVDLRIDKWKEESISKMLKYLQ